jgi:NADH:ubiquinone oxidoreductase subunit 6 (subunit J)
MDSIDIFLYVGYILIIIGALLAIVMPLIKSLDDPKGLVKGGLAIVGLVVVFFIAYSIADSEVLPRFAAEPFNLTPGLSKFVGGSLITTYALVLLALAGIVLTEINKAVK